jgi:hypothetical protein
VTCLKKPYATRIDALTQLRRIQHENDPKHTEQSYYRCDECRCYHLTSLPQDPRCAVKPLRP